MVAKPTATRYTPRASPHLLSPPPQHLPTAPSAIRAPRPRAVPQEHTKHYRACEPMFGNDSAWPTPQQRVAAAKASWPRAPQIPKVGGNLLQTPCAETVRPLTNWGAQAHTSLSSDRWWGELVSIFSQRQLDLCDCFGIKAAELGLDPLHHSLWWNISQVISPSSPLTSPCSPADLPLSPTSGISP